MELNKEIYDEIVIKINQLNSELLEQRVKYENEMKNLIKQRDYLQKIRNMFEDDGGV